MFVPEVVQHSVAFIFCDLNGQRTAAGTAFLVGVRGPVHNWGWTYAITARHVLDNIKDLADNNKVYFRLNRKGGKAEYIETNISDWVSHPHDHMVDVAVLSWSPPFTDYDVKVIWMDMFATDEIIEREHIGTGDEVFITGLFSKRLGLGRNIPIIRIGNIAAMPGEPIESEVGPNTGEMKGYLIEARSLSGLSGSPVFVNLGSIRVVNGSLKIVTTKSNDPRGVFYLIGLVHGHWETERASNKFPFTDESINTGIAIVTPIQNIMDVLNQPKLIQQRKVQMEEGMKKNKPQQDSNLLARSVVEAAIGEPLTHPKKPKKSARSSVKRAK